MDFATKKYINALAQEVLKEYNIDIPINNIENVVEDIGGKIQERDALDIIYYGTIRKEYSEDASFIIAISKDQCEERKNFTVAHELGHLFLHMGFRTDPDVWKSQSDQEYRRFGTSEQEYQANEFAAALLMPEKEYIEIMDKYTKENKVNITKVAEFFRVSRSAATNRGRFLGYIE